MAVGDLWTPGADFATNEVVTATKLNQQVRDDVYVLSLAIDGDTSTTTIKHRHLSGTAAARPAAGEAGREYYATDTKTLSIDNGTTWDTPVTVIRKTATSLVTNSTTLVNVYVADDPATPLNIPVAANEILAFEMCIFCGGPSGADVKFAFDVPTGATLVWSGIGPPTTISAAGEIQLNSLQTTDDGTLGFGTLTGTDLMVHLWGTLKNGANAGVLQPRWAQNTADGTGCSLNVNSWLKAHTVA